ncbi:hypothetical protein RKD24_005165 [Streptomyces calvus]
MRAVVRPVLGLVVRLGAERVVGPAGPAQREADLHQPAERRTHADPGGDPASEPDTAPAARGGLAAPHGVQAGGGAVRLREALPAVVRDGLDRQLVPHPGLLPAHQAGAARRGEGAGLLGQQAQQFRLVELAAQRLRQLPEDLAGDLLGRAQGDDAESGEEAGRRGLRAAVGAPVGTAAVRIAVAPVGVTFVAVARVGVRVEQDGGQPAAVVERDGARGRARRTCVGAGEEPCRAVPLELGLQRVGIARVGCPGAVDVGDPAHVPQPLAERVGTVRALGGRRWRRAGGGGRGGGRVAVPGFGAGRWRGRGVGGRYEGVVVVGAVVGQVQGAVPAARVERDDEGVSRCLPVGLDEPQVDVEGVRQGLREQVAERGRPQPGEFGRRRHQSLGAEPARGGGRGRHVGEVRVGAVPQDPLPPAGVAVGDDRLRDRVPLLGDPFVLVRVPHPVEGVHPQVVHHGEHRVRGRLGGRGGQFGPGDPVAQQPAQSGDVARRPRGRYGPAARGVEQRPEQAVPTAGCVQPLEGGAVRAHGVSRSGSGGNLAEQGQVVGRALRPVRRGCRPGRRGPGEFGVLVVGAESEQRFAVGPLVGIDDLVEDGLVEGGRRVPEHVRAVHHGDVLGPHLLDQRVVPRMRDTRAVRRRDVEDVVIAGQGTLCAVLVHTVDHAVLDDEPVLRLVRGHRGGQFAELGGTLVETRQDLVPLPLGNGRRLRQDRPEVTDQPHGPRIRTQKDIGLVDGLGLDLLRLGHRPGLEPLRSTGIGRPYIDDQTVVPRHLPEALEVLLRNPVRVTRRVRVDLTGPERRGPGEFGVLVVGAETEQRFAVGPLVGIDDLVEDGLVEGGRRVPEHVRAVHHGDVLGPHLLDQRVVPRMGDAGTARRRHVEEIVIAGDGTLLTVVVHTVDHAVLDDEPVLRLERGHHRGQFTELRGTLVETRQDPVPLPLGNGRRLRQDRPEVTDQPHGPRIRTQKDIGLVDGLGLDLLRLGHRPGLEPLRSTGIGRPYIDDQTVVPRHLPEALEVLLRNPVRVTRRVRVDLGRLRWEGRRLVPGDGGRGRRVVQAACQLGGVLRAEAQIGQRQRCVRQRPGDLRRGRVGESAHVLPRKQCGRRQFGRRRGQQDVERGVRPGGGPQVGRRTQERGVLLRGGAGRRIDGGAARGGVPVGDHPVQQVRGHSAVAVAGRGVGAQPAQAVHEGEPGEQLPVLRPLFGVLAEGAAQRADLLEGTGPGEGVGGAGTRVQAGVARQRVQVGAGGLGSEQPPPPRPVRALGEHRADIAVPVAGRTDLGGRCVHRPSRPVRHVLRHRQTGHLRLPPGLAGEQHQRAVLVTVARPGLEHLAELYTADLHGGARGVLGAEGDGTGGAVCGEVVAAPLAVRTGERGRRSGEHGAAGGRFGGGLRRGPRPRGRGGLRGRAGGRCRRGGRGAHAAERVLPEQRAPPRVLRRTVLGRALRNGQRPYGAPGFGPYGGVRHQPPQL